MTRDWTMILTLNYFKINVCIYTALVFQYYTHTFFILEWGGNDELCSNYNWTYRYAFVLNFLGLQQKSSKLKLKFIFSLSMILFYFKKSKIALLKNIDFSFLFILFYLFPFFFLSDLFPFFKYSKSTDSYILKLRIFEKFECF